MPSPKELLQIGVQLHQARRFEEARQSYQKILQADPDHADANHLLGLAFYETRNYETAAVHLKRAVAKRRSNAQYLNSLGAVHRALAQFADAQSAFERAIRVQPGYADPYNNLGTVLYAQGKYGEAEAIYRKAITLKPDHADAYANLGAVLKTLHRFADAEQSLRTAVRLAPQNPAAWNNLGNVCKAQSREREAIDCYRSALRADPNYAIAAGNLGLALQAQGEWHGAVEAFDRALQVTGSAGVAVKRALVLPVILDSTEQLAEARRRFDVEVERILASDLRIADPHREAGAGVFHLAYHGINDRERYRRVAEMFAHVCPALDYVAPHCLAPRPSHFGGATPRVGFISQFFHNHSIGRHFGGLFRNFPRQRFRIVLLRFPGSGDEMAQMLEADADETVILPPDLFQARAEIAALGLDVLYYTDIGMDPLTYFLAFARLAPVQCVAAGHPVTTGIPALDYFISCEAAEIPEGDLHYSEQLVRMKSIPNYFERPFLIGPTPPRAEFGLSDDWHVYLCAQNLCKLHPDFDPLLGEILRRDPQGRVILFHGSEPAWSERLVGRLRRSIPDVAERVGFLPQQPLDRFMHLLTLADAILDSTHFNGGTTSAQALGVGAPVVTWPGEFMRARQCYCNYRHMGLFDCVARDAEDYVRIAVRLATDGAFRADVRSKILDRNAVLYDNPSFAFELENFLAQTLEQRGRRAA